MKNFDNARPIQPGNPKPRVKKSNCNTVTVVHETARAGDEDFAYFVTIGKLRSETITKSSNPFQSRTRGE